MTGFSIIDGNDAVPRAVPRSWLLLACAVIVAQWIISAATVPVNYFYWSRAGADPFFLGLEIGAWWALLWNVLPFGLLGALTVEWSRRLHGRGFGELGVSLRAMVGAAPWILVGIIAALPLMPRFFSFGVDGAAAAGQALALLVPAVMIQAGAEELLFRGVILVCLVARYGSLAGLFLSAALFAFWHVYPGQHVVDLVVHGLTTFVFGLTAGLVVLRQGHLGGAIALHLTWNIAQALFAGMAHGPDSFWTSYVSDMSFYWAMEEFFSDETSNKLVLPLLIETLLVLVVCKSTVFDVIARRTRRCDADKVQSTP
jgi:membrane protease YdiL (CAAX protease family)